jgi:hypothetical protein
MKAQRYRKKPVVIEAWRLDRDNHHSIANWIVESGTACYSDTYAIIIQTLEGEMRADPGDWIVCGVKGEFYPVRDDIFRATYEPTNEEVEV